MYYFVKNEELCLEKKGAILKFGTGIRLGAVCSETFIFEQKV